MPLLALINEKTARPGLAEIGDVVTVQPDGHRFSAIEVEHHTIVKVGGGVEDWRRLIALAREEQAGLLKDERVSSKYPVRHENGRNFKTLDRLPETDFMSPLNRALAVSNLEVFPGSVTEFVFDPAAEAAKEILK